MNKNNVLIVLIFLTSFQFFGQNNNDSREKIKALKVAYLTDELNLTTIEAEKFWPLYNKHEKNLASIRQAGVSELKQKLKNGTVLSDLSEAEAKKFVTLRTELDKKIANTQELFINKLSHFLSYKKILKLQVSEREFARKLMRKYGKGKR